MLSPPPDEFRNRVMRARSAMRDAGQVGLVVSTQAGFVYFTGLRFDAMWSSATRSMVAVIPADGPLHLCLPSFVADEAREAWPDAVVHRYDVPPQSVVPHVVDAIGALPAGAIGFELGKEARMGVTPADFQAIAGCVDRVRVVDGQEVLWSLRMVKSPYEIACLRAAGHATSVAFAQALAGTLSGATERELARRIASAAIGAGADTVGWIAMTSGPGSYSRFVSAPRNRIIQDGDLVWADVGVRVDGYWSDFCRAVVVGGPSPRQLELHEAVVEATGAGVEVARAGTAVAEVAVSVRDRSTSLGLVSLGFGRLGHGIGLDATEPPSVAEFDETVLAPGMVITVEPAVVDRSGLYCAEQVLAITDGAPEVLSRAPTSLGTVR